MQISCRLLFLVLLMSPGLVWAQDDFKVPPYLQYPAPDGITIMWLSHDATPGRLIYDGGGLSDTLTTDPVQQDVLAYPAFEIALNPDEFPNGAPPVPYLHRVRLQGLVMGTAYTYSVEQRQSVFQSQFRTTPSPDEPIRFIAYADSETEPTDPISPGVQTNDPVSWTDPSGLNPERRYLIDQTLGYANNLAVIRERNPDFVAISGDLVESGGEQRDWDEFWRQNTNINGTESLAGSIPILPALGNHEYFSSPHRASTMPLPREYNQPYSEEGVSRYLTYFDVPPNEVPIPEQEERYYRLDYGPVSIISLDVSNGSPNESDGDTNFYLLGPDDPDGGFAPGFAPGTAQYAWLEAQLQSAQSQSQFTFVLLHHVPYSVGPHGLPPGLGEGFDPHSGVPVQALTDLFLRYGVDAVLAGHDETWERSEVIGMEQMPDGSEREYTLQIFDLGVGGDGLRGPVDGLGNPNQAFYVHTDVPEVWDGNRLVDGGKHYGHLEVNVSPIPAGGWRADLMPTYVFPLFDQAGTTYMGYERRVYPDSLSLFTADAVRTATTPDRASPNAITLEVPYPNPIHTATTLKYTLHKADHVELKVYDVLGRVVATLVEDLKVAGSHSVQWEPRDTTGRLLPTGMYLSRLEVAGQIRTQILTVIRS